MRWSLIKPPRWKDLETGRLSSRSALVVLVFAGLACFFLGLDHYTSPPSTDHDPGTFVERAANKKVFLLIIDSLTPEIVDSGRLSFLEPLVNRGFRAEIEPCADRMTIPCIRDAFTGASSFGLFGAFDNLIVARGVDSNNLFADLRRDGRTSGAVGPGVFDQFLPWIDRDEQYEKEEVEAVVRLLKEGIDFVAYHYAALDTVTHRAPLHGPAYQAALTVLDQDVRRIVAVLPPEYEFVVAGDHGHDSTGRHIQGLDVPTVYLSSGNLWGRRFLPQRIPISSYRFLLGAEFGILPPPSYEGADLSSLLPPGSALALAAEGVRYKPARLSAGFPYLMLATGLAVAALLYWIGPDAWRRNAMTKGLSIGALVVAVAAGASYLALIDRVHSDPEFPTYASLLAWIVAALALAGLAVSAMRHLAAAILALVWICFPQTLYAYGFYAQILTLGVAAAFGFILLQEPREWLRDRHSLLRDLSVLLALAGVAALLAPVAVLNFAILGFPGLMRPAWFYLAFPALWGVLVAHLDPLPSNRLSAKDARIVLTLLGALAAAHSALTPYPPWLIAALIAATAAAVFSRHVTWLILLAATLLPQLVSLVPAYGVALTVAFVWLILWASSKKQGRQRWVEAGLVASLAYFATAYVSGLRANGIDFRFALDWLPADRTEDLWFVVAAALMVKVLLPAALVFCLLQTHGRLDLRAPIQILICARIAASMLFTVGFVATLDALPPFRLLEICEDMIVWWLLLAVASFVPRKRSSGELQSPSVIAAEC